MRTKFITVLAASQLAAGCAVVDAGTSVVSFAADWIIDRTIATAKTAKDVTISAGGAVLETTYDTTKTALDLMMGAGGATVETTYVLAKPLAKGAMMATAFSIGTAFKGAVFVARGIAVITPFLADYIVENPDVLVAALTAAGVNPFYIKAVKTAISLQKTREKFEQVIAYAEDGYHSFEYAFDNIRRSYVDSGSAPQGNYTIDLRRLSDNSVEVVAIENDYFANAGYPLNGSPD